MPILLINKPFKYCHAPSGSFSLQARAGHLLLQWSLVRAVFLLILIMIFSCIAANAADCEKKEVDKVVSHIEKHAADELRRIASAPVKGFTEFHRKSNAAKLDSVNLMQESAKAGNKSKLRESMKTYIALIHLEDVYWRDSILRAITFAGPASGFEGLAGGAIARAITDDRYDTIVTCRFVNGKLTVPFFSDCQERVSVFMKDLAPVAEGATVCSLFWGLVRDGE